MTSTENTFLSTTQLATELGLTPGTLRNWRVNGRGPKGARIGGHVRYRRADIDAWIAQQTQRDPLVDRHERASEARSRKAARR
ncbi:helix-turn-helix transcriptional regulator [Geodermatophilus sp. SYSU D00079]